MKEKLKKIDFAVGGQAVIEGVMMRSPNFTVVSVRAPNNDIRCRKKHYIQLCRRYKLLSLPLVRGVVNLFEMMIIGMKALTYSSKQAMDDASDRVNTKKEKQAKKTSKEPTRDKKKNQDEKPFDYNKTQNALLFLTLIFSLFFSIFLFKFIPLAITGFLGIIFPALDQSWLFFNIVDGSLKILIFVAYVLFMTMFEDLKRVFMYHGAEHKSILAYENGKGLTVENAREQSRFHPRCGTSFILIVFLLSVLVYTALPRMDNFLQNFAIRIAFLPLIAAFSYEVLKLSAKNADSTFFSLITMPGLLMQKLTTKEPTDEMLEVALHSLKTALQSEENLLKKYEETKNLKEAVTV